jgi:hypothetical protein
VVAEKSKDIERLQQGLEHIATSIPLLIVPLEELKGRGLMAVPQPRSHMFGNRTIFEQMEIDLVRQQSEEPEDKDGNT